MLNKLFLTITLLAFFITPVRAQTDQPTTVEAVMFFMSGCKHCQQTIDLTLPPIREKYGPRFNLQLVEIYTIEEIDALYALGASYGIEKHMLGVPFLVIGDQPLVGYDQIRLNLPDLIETHLAAGGVTLSERPELSALLGLISESPHPTPASATNSDSKFPTAPPSDGFILAIGVLVGMLLAVLFSLIYFLRALLARNFSLPDWPWLFNLAVPALSLAGLFVAAYLSYIELTFSPAFCGPIGDCNAVQSSPYARLFGILPVGVLGLVGYLLVLLLWWLSRQRLGLISMHAPLALFGAAFFGTLFSAYLTYLEPFVIKAVCSWCIASAILITLVMLAALPRALSSLAASSRA